jgi:aminotransferase
MYRKKRDRFCGALKSVGFDIATPQGAYYVMADTTPFSARGDVAFAKRLVEDVGVAVVPGTSFYADPRTGRRFVRFMFSKKDETLEEAVRRLQKLRRGADP